MNQATKASIAVLVGLVISACAASTASPGVTNMQPSSSCLGDYLQCTQDSDCCSGLCAGQICSKRSR